MRFLHALLPAGTRDPVEEVLEANDIPHAIVEEGTEGADAAVLFAPLGTDAVEDVLETLRSVGVEEGGFVVVSDVQAVVPERLAEREDEREAGESARVSREELQATMREQLRGWTDYAVFTVLSAVLATAGLLTDSPTVITGSMVVAPLLGPAIAFSVGSVVGDSDLARTGLRAQLVGVALAVLSATAFAALVRVLFVPALTLTGVEQITEFSEPIVFALVIALVAGVAGALSLTSDISTALVGVAVAAAIVPPSGTVGIGIVYGDAPVAAGGALLVLVNLLSINLTSLLTLHLKGYRPSEWADQEEARRVALRRALALGLSVLVVSAAVGFATYNRRVDAAFEEEVRELAADSESTVVDVDVRYEDTLLTREPRLVVVRTADAPPGFAGTFAERIRRTTGKDVGVVVYTAASAVNASGNAAGPIPAAATPTAYPVKRQTAV